MKRKIKILHLTTDAKIAGAERLLIELGEKCDRNAFEVQFCTLSKYGCLHKALEEMGFTTYALDMNRGINIFNLYLRLSKLLKKEKFDILHTHLFLSSFLGLLAGKFNKVPIKVMTRHYSDYMYLFGNPFTVQMDRCSLRLADKIIVVSEAAKKIINGRDNIPFDKLVTIYNGIDLNKFSSHEYNQAAAKKELCLSGSFIIGAVGSLEKRKGHSFLIKAAPQIIKQIPNAKFVIVGAGALLNSLQKQVKRLNLKRYFCFLGYRLDIEKVVSAFDVFVHPSAEEGFGIVILEALAIGKPIVAYCVGGIPEIITNNSFTRLVPPGDTKMLAEEIIKISGCSFDNEQLRNEGRGILKQNFDIINMVKKYEQLYRELIHEKGKNAVEIA